MSAQPWASAVASAIRRGEPPSPEAITAVTQAVPAGLATASAQRARAALTRALLGLGPLEALVRDPRTTDVLVNGDGLVWVDRGGGLAASEVVIGPADLRPLAVRLAGLARRRLDDAQPWVDGLLPGGVRLHAVLPPVVDGGPHISLRIPRHQPVGVDGLVALGAVTPELGAVLRGIVAARVSFVVTGGTGTGKTTVLGALLAECDPSERIVLVEDVRELTPAHPHVVALQGRAANVEGAGLVTLVDLVRQALRMRPDRLVVGEVRGPEVRELLAALNTGHEGGGGTVHANRVEELPARFEALGALAGLPREAVHAQLAGALDVVIGVARRAERRFVAQVGVLTRVAGECVVEPAWSVRDGALVAGPGAARLDRVVTERA